MEDFHRGFERDYRAAQEVIKKQTAELAAEQAKNVGLRDALQRLWDESNLEPIPYVQEALSTQSDTSALETMIAKAGELMRAECQSACSGPNGDWNIFPDEIEQAIRAIPAVKLDDFK